MTLRGWGVRGGFSLFLPQALNLGLACLLQLKHLECFREELEAGTLRDGEELQCHPGTWECPSWDRAGRWVRTQLAHPERGGSRSQMGQDHEGRRERLLAIELGSVLAEFQDLECEAR